VRVSLRRIVVALSFSPVGSRNKASPAIDALLDGEAATLTRKALELAKAADMQALKLCMDRMVPPRRDRPVSFLLPKIRSRPTPQPRWLPF